MLRDECYKPLLGSVTTRLSTGLKKPAKATDVGAVVNEPQLECEPKLEYVDTDVLKVSDSERMIAAGMSAEVAGLISRFRIGLVINEMESETSFVCAFGNTRRRVNTLGTNDDKEYYYLGATALRLPSDSAFQIVTELLMRAKQVRVEGDTVVHSTDFATLSDVYTSNTELFDDAMMSRLMAHDDDSKVLISIERGIQGVRRECAMECAVSCLAALSGTGASVLLAGIRFDGSAGTLLKYIVTIEPKETDADSPSLLSAKILQTVSIMSSVGIVHTALLTNAVSSAYNNKLVVTGHERTRCVLFPSITPSWAEFVMAGCALADLIRTRPMSDIPGCELLPRTVHISHHSCYQPHTLHILHTPSAATKGRGSPSLEAPFRLRGKPYCVLCASGHPHGCRIGGYAVLRPSGKGDIP
jgi:hypothetical protein